MGKKKATPVARPSERKDIIVTVRISDCKVEAFPAGGPGGQHQNKSSTAVRVTHPPSGAVGISREHRSQLQNKEAAFRRMAESPKFRVWAMKQELGNPLPPEEQVERDMHPSNLLIMGRENGKWKIID